VFDPTELGEALTEVIDVIEAVGGDLNLMQTPIADIVKFSCEQLLDTFG
jgi:hypothetical protein